jgi:hypothetical protein
LRAEQASAFAPRLQSESPGSSPAREVGQADRIAAQGMFDVADILSQGNFREIAEMLDVSV